VPDNRGASGATHVHRVVSIGGSSRLKAAYSLVDLIFRQAIARSNGVGREARASHASEFAALISTSCESAAMLEA
jgi:hypothetical protein